MATFLKDKKTGEYRAIIRRKGHRTVSQSGFASEREAKDWALVVESEMLHGITLPDKAPATRALTLGEALADYSKNVTPKKKSAARETDRIKKLCLHSLAKKSLRDIRPVDITGYINERRQEVGDATIRLEVMLLSALYTYRIKELHDDLTNPVSNVKLPAKSKSRGRVLGQNELDYLRLGFVEAMPKTKNIDDLLMLAVETGMRQSELLSIVYNDIDTAGRFVRLDDTKSGDPRNVPLSPAAIEILKKLNTGADDKTKRIFAVTQDALVRAFPKACALGRKLLTEETGEPPSPRFLSDLKFHDLRHESASRWARVLQAQELAAMFGWKTLSMVMRYYSASASSIADKLA